MASSAETEGPDAIGQGGPDDAAKGAEAGASGDPAGGDAPMDVEKPAPASEPSGESSAPIAPMDVEKPAGGADEPSGPAADATTMDVEKPAAAAGAPAAGSAADAPMDVEKPATATGVTAGTKTSDQKPPAAAEPVDRVVRECDIYLNRMCDPPDFVGDMYLLQYPLRPQYRPYGDQGQLSSVELKPKGRRLRFTYKLDESDNYDDGGTLNDRVGQHVLSSTVLANPACSYAVGVIHHGKMVLTPIRAVNQLRPDLSNFDKTREQSKNPQEQKKEEQKKEATEKPEGAEDSGEEAPAAEDSGALQMAQNAVAAPVRVEYSKSDRGRQLDGQKPAEPEEEWRKLHFYSRESDESRDVYEKHIVWAAAEAAEAQARGAESEHPKLQRVGLDGDREQLLGIMCGQITKRKERKVEEEDDGLDSHMLSRMPPERQVEAIVRQYSVVPFAKVRKRLPPNTLRTHSSDVAIIELLKECAVVVAGNWVLKSEKAGFDDMEAHIRDMLLVLMNKGSGVLAKEAYDRWAQFAQGCTQSQTRDEIIRSLSYVRGQELRLKKDPDESFKKRHPKVVQEYNAMWDKQAREIIVAMKARAASGPRKGVAESAQKASSTRQQKKLKEDVRQQLASGALTLEELRRRMQRQNTTTEISVEMLQQVLQDPELDAVRLHDLWMQRNTGHVETDKFRAVLISLFRVRDTVTKTEIQQEYQTVHGSNCELSDYQKRIILREMSEPAPGKGDHYVLKGVLQRK